MPITVAFATLTRVGTSRSRVDAANSLPRRYRTLLPTAVTMAERSTTVRVEGKDPTTAGRFRWHDVHFSLLVPRVTATSRVLVSPSTTVGKLMSLVPLQLVVPSPAWIGATC